MNPHRPLLVALALLALLAACGPRGPLRSFTTGDELAYYSFDRSGDFEQGTYGPASLLVRDGVYRIDVREGDNELWWGQWGDAYGDVVIDVDAVQRSQRNENAFGVMCRVRGHVGQPVDAAGLSTEATAEATADATAIAEPTDEATASTTAEATADATRETAAGTVLEAASGDGYLFLIQGTGSYAIMRARGRDLTPLVGWQTSDAIRVGPAENHLRAVCAGDYLALYVNDVLVADTTDDTYQSGQVGLAASAASRLGARIEFDNLTVKAASAG